VGFGAQRPRTGETPNEEASLEFSEVYDRFFDEVERWIRAMGVPSGEQEDLAQEVFVVVGRKLQSFDGRNLPGWLYRIAWITVHRYRRRPWYRYLFSRREDAELDDFEWVGSGPAESVERRQLQERLQRVLAKMSEKRRTALVLFELEGYSGEEIAQRLEIPVATVWTRLYHARQEFISLAGELKREREG
jgi:RNA polymerase sigma-70 factor (ECF subfamily)